MPVQKKKQSKVSKVLSFFNPRNLKGGMALFALVFALGGAGYFVYSSFALEIPKPANYSSKAPIPTAVYTLQVGPGSMGYYGSEGTLVHDTVLSSKSGANTVLKLSSPASGSGSGAYVAGIGSSFQDYIFSKYKNHKTFTCISARGDGNSNTFGVNTFSASGESSSILTYYRSIPASYKVYCSGIGTVATRTTSTGMPEVQNDAGGHDIYISNITVYVL